MKHPKNHCKKLIGRVIYQSLRYIPGLAAVLMLTAPPGFAGPPDNYSSEERKILDAREFNVREIQSFRQGLADTAAANGEIELQFHAYDQDFSLVLQRNTRFLNKVQSDINSDVELYKGKIVGNDSSWVRLNRMNGVFTGAVYDGDELYMIDEHSIVMPDMAPSMQQQFRTSGSGSLIYRMSDVEDTATCGVPTRRHRRSSYRSLIQDLQSSNALQAAAAADRQVNLTIVVDTEYAATSRDTNGQVLSQMNVVDGIFSEQVGVQFGIQDIISLSSNGPLTSTNPSSLLNAFRSYANNQIRNPGLAHLFSGKNLNGNVIGIAYLSALCTRNGVGVTQAGGRGVSGALTVAHEFGHNFGAPHDNQGGSACSNTPGRFLMNPSLNGSDQFSQCSLSQISRVVSRASCLVDANPDPDPNPTPEPECIAGALDLRNVRAYSGNNTGNATVSRNGCSITLDGNIWRITETGVDIAAETTVTFDFTASGTGEIQGIGFDENTGASANRVFRLAGTQNWGINDFSYSGNGQPQRITIPVGQYYTGVDLGFVIANDKDSGSQNNKVTVSNVVVSNTPAASCIKLNDVSPFSNTNTGTFGVSNNNCEMTLQGNIWRATSERFDITPTTVLSFEFSANGTGEIHGIGFDEDNTATSSRIFKLTGSQNWGLNGFSYSGTSTQKFEIPVGNFYTGSSMRLILVNDKDSGNPDNQTVIRNVKLFNQQ